jgi:hypothetical protein
MVQWNPRAVTASFSDRLVKRRAVQPLDASIDAMSTQYIVTVSRAIVCCKNEYDIDAVLEQKEDYNHTATK